MRLLVDSCAQRIFEDDRTGLGFRSSRAYPIGSAGVARSSSAAAIYGKADGAATRGRRLLLRPLTCVPTHMYPWSTCSTLQAYHVLPYFAAKLAAELPVGAIFPLLFGVVVYPMAGLNPKPSR